jgi:hypothetical protein
VGSFPWLNGTMRYSELRSPFPPRFVLLRLAVPRPRRRFVSPNGWRRPSVGQGLRVPVAPCRLFEDVETNGTPRFLGNPRARALLSDPGGIGNAWPIAALRCCLPQVQQRRLPLTQSLRGSITQPMHSLSTLRSAGYPDTTQDSLPAAGYALPGGFGYPRGSNEKFPPTSRLPPFPGFAWRNGPALVNRRGVNPRSPRRQKAMQARFR